MSLTAEQHNSLYGTGLAVTLIDMIRNMHGKEQRITTSKLTRTLMQRMDIEPDQFKRVYARVKKAVVDLEKSGHVTRTEQRTEGRNIYAKHIIPCSASENSATR